MDIYMKVIHKNFNKENTTKMLEFIEKYYYQGVKKDKSGIILQNIKGR